MALRRSRYSHCTIALDRGLWGAHTFILKILISKSGGFIDGTLDRSPLVSLCDDGSTVLSVVNSRIWVYLHAVRAQPGHPLPECYLRVGLHVSTYIYICIYIYISLSLSHTHTHTHTHTHLVVFNFAIFSRIIVLNEYIEISH
jgi:hypothetical protein